MNLAITKDELKRRLSEITEIDNIDFDHLMIFVKNKIDEGQLENNKEAILNFLSLII